MLISHRFKRTLKELEVSVSIIWLLSFCYYNFNENFCVLIWDAQSSRSLRSIVMLPQLVEFGELCHLLTLVASQIHHFHAMLCYCSNSFKRSPNQVEWHVCLFFSIVQHIFIKKKYLQFSGSLNVEFSSSFIFHSL